MTTPSLPKAVAVIGAGTMGNGIAQVFATCGVTTHLVDIKSEFVEKGVANVHKSLAKFQEKNTLTADQVAQTKARLKGSTDMGVLAGVDLDRKAMPYALRNLLRNAFKYASQRISVNAEMVDDNILIHVDDDGIGIPPGEREHIFSAFTRLDRSRDRSTGGYGLGLAIARRVLELHGGTAIAEASPLGGARFTLTWKAHH